MASFPNRISAFIAGGLEALVKAQEGAEDNIKEANLYSLKFVKNENDVLIATCKWLTLFTIEATKEASKCNALTIAIVNKNTELEKYAKISLVIETDMRVSRRVH